MELPPKEEEARKRVCLALDVPTVSEALTLAEHLSDYVGTAKVGKELHTAAGNEGVNIVRELYARGVDIFLDLKLKDTPATVYGASKQCAAPGVYMFNIHIEGEDMCKRAIEGAHDGAGDRERPKVIGVTVLTSLSDEDLEVQGIEISYDDLVKKRTELAREWGLDGVVCPANKAGELEKQFGSDFTYVTPGVQWKGVQGKGQKQLYLPNRAVQDCSSSILVIGSAITKAKDQRKAAYEILQVMAEHL